MASFAALATRNFTTFFAAILIAAPVAGFRPNDSDIGLHEGATSCFWRVPSGADTAPRYSHLLVGGRPSYVFPPWREGPRSAAEWSAPWKRSFCASGSDKNRTVSRRGIRQRALHSPCLLPGPTALPPPTRPWPFCQSSRSTAVFPARCAVEGEQSEFPCPFASVEASGPERLCLPP